MHKLWEAVALQSYTAMTHYMRCWAMYAVGVLLLIRYEYEVYSSSGVHTTDVQDKHNASKWLSNGSNSGTAVAVVVVLLSSRSSGSRTLTVDRLLAVAHKHKLWSQAHAMIAVVVLLLIAPYSAQILRRKAINTSAAIVFKPHLSSTRFAIAPSFIGFTSLLVFETTALCCAGCHGAE
jgi:hypothetical protein